MHDGIGLFFLDPMVNVCEGEDRGATARYCLYERAIGR